MTVLRSLLVVALSLLVPVTALAATKPKAGGANRLVNAASPYLRQHANNPVDWHTWGAEAFEKAKREGKPVFLSVGYATCYWCHVMARESFEDAGVAKLLNAHTVPVKVDRERRPGVDATYMLATELIAQSGGWPNSVFLTPDLKPFFGFGYVPRDRFKELIAHVADGWKDQREVILADAARLSDIIARAMNRRAANVEITEKVLRRASMHILARFDVFNGGLGTAPKFPQDNVIQFLLHRGERDGDKVSLDAALLTLDNMIRGGIHDHVGGGFHRYAVDNAWAIPHFEKMLYNQALTTRALLKAYELTGYPRYREAARRALDFVLAEMTLPGGGFASAFDAETDGKEGLYYLWSEDAFKAALGDDAAFGAAVFGVTGEGNHEGSNTLRLTGTIEELAEAQKMTPAALAERLQKVRVKLAEARAARKPLIRDDKVLTGWNALMIRALAEAAVTLGEPHYLEAAKRAQAFIAEKLVDDKGDLKRSFFDGAASLPATQADYAFMGLSAVALFDATRDARWLKDAIRLGERMVALFADDAGGGFFLTGAQSGFTRTKEIDDSTIPSGNGAALELFARLVQRTEQVQWRQRALAQQAVLSGIAVSEPVSHTATLLAADILERGETGARQSAAHGAAHLAATRLPGGKTARIRIQLAPEWHINSTAPKQDFLLPTRIRAEGLGKEAVTFPAPIERTLGFHDEPLSLYEGTVDIEVRLPEGDAGRAMRRLTLDVQACSDRVCLNPQVVRLLLPAAAGAKP